MRELKNLDDVPLRMSATDIHDLFRAVDNQLSHLISKLDEFIEAEKAIGYGETEDS